MTSQSTGTLTAVDDGRLEPLGLPGTPDPLAEARDLPGTPEPEVLPEGAVRLEPWRLWLPGGLSRPGGTAGAGFAAGQVAEDIPPGEVLAGLTADVWAERERVSDDELIGLARAWRRLASWAAAGELAAVAELAARREAQVAAGADPHIAEHVSDEIAAALTVTGRAADRLVTFAVELARLPLTAAALAAGEIDRARAGVIAEETACLTAEHAAAVEAAVIGRAPGQTSSQLRAAAKRAALRVDPAAAGRRRKEALARARVEAWDEQSGTAAIAGRDLPPADVLAADKRIDTLARHLKTAGAPGTLDSLRARVYTALLLGIPLAVLHAQLTPATEQPAPATEQLTPAPATGHDGERGHDGDGHHGSASERGGAGEGSHENDSTAEGSHENDSTGGDAGARDDASGIGGALAGSAAGLALAGSVNLTMPLSTWLGGDAPGEADGYWTLPAADTRSLADLLAGQAGTRICLTLTSPDGQAVAHGCTRIRVPGPPGQLPELAFTIKPLASPGNCLHDHQAPGYRPPGQMRHRVSIRHRRCAFPGCGRRAARCDLDHTTPYDQGGQTCDCNLAPLCRRHHRAKQAQGWALQQETGGTLTWTLPHGRRYRAGPDLYPPG